MSAGFTDLAHCLRKSNRWASIIVATTSSGRRNENGKIVGLPVSRSSLSDLDADDQVQHLSRASQEAGHDLRIYDFAVGGSFLLDVKRQAEKLARIVKEGKVDVKPDSAILSES